ncbi:4Fe-4S binding protein [Paraclostridium bifermentans]|uniref:4Fe-4S binding protein n=1 Tax=Paraclostridium bifermentans TaxID=1490 RepID=UPI00290E251A|nr:4Fe-4S dicluster domain-containing protein [Paraclostridium bifermentans]MDU3801594.1 4Fe-4S dicluster domain-containing protein [Paraclostridium bifermentans]
MIKKYKLPILMFLVFEIVAITLWLVLDNCFYFFNFSYIGICIAIGLFLHIKKFKYARLVVQFSVGLYMLVYLGLICQENMLIEGFWYYLCLGVFQVAVIHYVIAKICGPFIFGRGWCGYACWTAMILDFLPYKIPQAPRKKKIGIVKYILFVFSFAFVGTLFVLQIPNLEKTMFISFIIGNILYYIVGIAIAFLFKDNRAFCKYICPVTIFLKPASYFSILRVKCDKEKCINCGKCKKVCPMNVDVINNNRNRENGTECILCTDCINQCSQKALHF